jgi:hypothetical protein
MVICYLRQAVMQDSGVVLTLGLASVRVLLLMVSGRDQGRMV